MGKDRHFRRDITYKIGDLIEKHCKGCEDPKRFRESKFGSDVTYCNNKCEHGIEIRRYGKMLEGEGNVKVSQFPKELTKEVLIELKEKGIKDNEIKDRYGLNNAKFYKMKNDWGLVNKFQKASKNSQPPVKSQQEVPVTSEPKVISLVKYNELQEALELARDEIRRLNSLGERDMKTIESLKAQNRQLKNNQVSHLDENTKEENQKLKTILGELRGQHLRKNSQISLLERENEELVRRINELMTYQFKYNVTKEALKAHL